MLVYATSNKNLQKDFYSAYLTHQLLEIVCTNTWKSMYSKVIFLIASDSCSLIIATNAFFAFGSYELAV